MGAKPRIGSFRRWMGGYVERWVANQRVGLLNGWLTRGMGVYVEGWVAKQRDEWLSWRGMGC